MSRRARTHAHARTHARMQSRTHARTQADTHARTQSRTHSYTHTVTHTQTHSYTHTVTPTHAHTTCARVCIHSASFGAQVCARVARRCRRLQSWWELCAGHAATGLCARVRQCACASLATDLLIPTRAHACACVRSRAYTHPGNAHLHAQAIHARKMRFTPPRGAARCLHPDGGGGSGLLAEPLADGRRPPGLLITTDLPRRATPAVVRRAAHATRRLVRRSTHDG